MKLRRIEIGDYRPLSESSIEFSSGLNLIRGDNGAGKTLLLEIISILGHSPVMTAEHDAEMSGAVFRYDVEIEKFDIAFLDRIFERSGSGIALSEDGKSWVRAYAKVTQYSDIWNEESLCALGRSLVAKGVFKAGFKSLPLRVGVRIRDGKIREYDKLKHDLANDHRDEDCPFNCSLDRNWMFLCAEPGLEKLIPLLQSISRPARSDERKKRQAKRDVARSWHKSLRTALLDTHKEEAKNLPGFVTYINTDMYEWGAGLDLRESPKQLRTDLSTVAKNRLVLLSDPNDRMGTDPLYYFRDWDKMKQTWKSAIFKGTHTPELSAASYSENTDEWRISFKTQSDISVFSSGENQAFFLLAMTVCTRPHNSIFLFDEPELHLSLSATESFFRYLIDFSETTESQVIVVTHSLFHGDTIKSEPDKSGDVFEIYLEQGKEPLTGPEAIRPFALQAHRDIKRALRPMMLPEDDVRIFQWKRFFGNDR